MRILRPVVLMVALFACSSLFAQNFLKGGQWISVVGGNRMDSLNGNYMGRLANNGQFCISKTFGPPAQRGLWCTPGKPKDEYFMAMQPDGNLCIYSGTSPENRHGDSKWCASSNRGVSFYFVQLQDDSRLCVYKGTDPEHKNGDAIWCSGNPPL
jgi:hypothetical protein